MSKDNELVVLHGGDDGELNHYGLNNEYIFNWTKEQLQTRIDIGEGQRIPTLQSVIDLCQNCPKMLLNIELKGPWSEEVKNQYDHTMAARKTIDMINENDIANKVMISSFNNEVLDAVISVSATPRRFMVQRLTSPDFEDDRDQYNTFEDHSGVNIFFNYITEQVVNKVHQQGNNKIGLWHCARRNTENDHMYRQIFTIGGGVDFFFSDKPVEAMLARDQLQ